MRTYAITIGDGTVRIMSANDLVDPMVETQKWHADTKARLAPVSAREIDLSDIPASKKLKKAWVDKGGKIVVDVPKGKVERKLQMEAALGRKLTGPEASDLNRKNNAKDLEDHKI